MAIKFLNTVAVDTNVLYVDAANNRVGIGDTTPNRPLVVSETRTGSTASDAYTTVVKSVQSSGASPNPGTGGLKVQYTSSSNNVHAFGLVAGSSSSDFLTTGPMHFYTNSDLDTVSATGFAMVLDTSQRLGIGLTNPSQKLTVSGNVMAGRYYSTGTTVYYLDPSDTTTAAYVAGPVRIRQSSSYQSTALEVATATGSTGDDGIFIKNYWAGGPPTVSSKNPFLSIGCADSAGHKSSIYLGEDASPANQESKIEYTHDSAVLNISVKGQGSYREHVRFGNQGSSTPRTVFSGNVGIGTASPSHELHITGTGQASDDFRAPIFYDSASTGYYLDPANTGIAAYLRGDIEIINEQPLLELNDYTATGQTNLNAWVSFQYNGTEAGYVGYGSDSTNYLYLTNYSGRVSINGSFTEHAGSSRAPIFYDSNNTNYYADLASATTSISLAGRITGNSQQVRVKYSVWSGDQYGIGMKSGFSYGHLNDYAMSFQMNDDADRGWWWGDTGHSDAQGAMSLTTAGRLTVANSISVGQGEGITSASTHPLFVDGTAVFDTTSGTEPVCITRSGSTSSQALKIGVTDTASQFIYIEDTSSEGTGNFGEYQFILAGNSGETSVTPLKLEKTKTTSNAGAFTFGTPGNGSNTLGRWLSFEGNTDSSGEGSGRLFFSEHNSSTTDMDDYGMSIGYRGGSTSVTTAGGNSWTGLSAIGNGEWGMWGHDNSLAGNIIMSGPRNGSYVRIHSSSGVRSKIYYDYDNTDFYFQPESTSGTSWRLQTSTGYVKIGSRNSSYVHFYTDRGQYYFDKGLTVDTGAIRSYNEDLNLNRAGSTTARIRVTSGVTHSDQYLQASGSLRAPVFYDSANTSYYADPASTSVFDRIVTGITSTSNGGTALRVEDTMGSATTRLAEFKYNQPSPTVYGGKGTRFYNVAYGGGAVEFYRSSQYGPDSTAVAFVTGSSTVGSISHSGSSTSYNTTSDYRLKENIIDLTGGIEKVKQLQPRRFNFIEDPDNTVDGFIAHEAELIVPESVTGEKDGVYPNGEPVYQAMDSAKLVPVLTAALQEAITKIEDLETRVQSLENQ